MIARTVPRPERAAMNPNPTTSRRTFLGRTAALTLAAALAPDLLRAQAEEEAADEAIAAEVIRRAEILAGLEFTDVVAGPGFHGPVHRQFRWAAGVQAVRGQYCQ